MSETGRQYWRSLQERANSPDVERWLQNEFPEGATELDAPSRRSLLKLMGASLGLAGLTACSRPVEKILPLSKGVEDYIPGNPMYYASVISLGGTATGLVVETHDGRPTKIEGNPGHPASGGACSAFAQASVLGLYDPDRSKTVLRNGSPASWDDFARFAAGHFDPARIGAGERLRFLSLRVNSPSLEAVRAHALARFPKARWIEYEPISEDEILAGAAIAFAKPVRPHYHFDKADVVFSLDADFLGLDSNNIAYIRDFSKRRRISSPKDTMNRLYMAESRLSITGAMADHRLRMKTGAIRDLALEVARNLNLDVPAASGPNAKWAAALARDLARSRGRSLVLAGPRQPAAVHALAHWINHALANEGATVTYTETGAAPELPALKQLAQELQSGQVETLVILGGNPAYDAPADLRFDAAMKNAPVTIHLGLDPNETAALAQWHLPEAHYLESWGDARALDGTVSIQQPMIRPLYGGKTAAEVLALIGGYKDRNGYDIVRNYWLPRWSAGDAEKAWRRALYDGVIPDTAYAPVEPALDAKRVAAALAGTTPPASQGLELTFYPSAATWDGRFADNGWLQEAPDPITKLTWDNAALVSPATARRLGLETEDIVVIAVGGAEIEMPVWVQPGQADDTIAVALGYGRRRAGRVGRNVGHDSYLLRTSAAPYVIGAAINRTGRKYKLANTQHHFVMEGRPLVREATLEEYRKDPDFVDKIAETPKLFSIFGQHDYSKGYQWGMAIDLNACVGCNACVLACQAENNVPIVGKDQVTRGREMHWLRLDRYFTGPEDDPQTVTQPVACQQCENAPCETVCPVAATSHSPEGLNDMVYNRCVGTRYCSNNCPYKVRRFNFLDWHKGLQEVEKMVFNPDVTVRMRGVMEKCTYCVQRIQEKKIQASVEGHRELRDGEIVPACQQTCPADAIVFGNINDPNSRVSKLKKQTRRYEMLAQLNVKPRTSYLAKVRNPNPELA
jgi:molybdopterin-containing oxidoreductase family iron-sulfur binding subunit